MADPRWRIQDGGSKMADARIKKFIGNVTKLNYFHAYIVNMSFQPGKLLAIHQVLLIDTILVK